MGFESASLQREAGLPAPPVPADGAVRSVRMVALSSARAGLPMLGAALLAVALSSSFVVPEGAVVPLAALAALCLAAALALGRARLAALEQ